LLERAGSKPWEFAFDREGRRMIVGSGSRTYDVVGLPQGSVSGIGYRHASQQVSESMELRPLLLSASNLVLTHDGRREVKIWRTQPLSAENASVQDAPATVSNGMLSAGGNRLALGTVGGDVRIVNVKADSALLIPPKNDERPGLHTSAVHRIGFSADAALLASGSSTGEVRLTDAGTGTPLDFNVRHPDGAIVDLEFAGDESALVSASNGLVLVSDTRSGERIAEYRVQGGEPQVSALRGENAVLISTVQGGVVAWNWQSGVQELLVPADKRVRHASVAHDDRLLVVATVDGEILLWDRESKEQIGAPVKVPGLVDEMWTWPDNTVLVVRSGTWILGYAMTPAGLQAQRSLLLPESTAAVQPDPEERIARVLTQVRSSRPLIVTMSLDAAQFEPLQGDVVTLQTEWRERLAYDEVAIQ